MMVKKKTLFQKDGRCLVCERKCLIKKGKRGYCSTKINDNGIIYTLNYNNTSSISINPIEKKPLFHFHPGSRALTVGFWSCNFTCPWCQNHDISKIKPQFREDISPENFIKMAIANSCEGTSLSFNEPTLFLEWGIEVFKFAKREKLYNTIVTNGYMTEQALKLFIDSGLDAANVDIKGDKNVVKKFCDADVEKIWRNCKAMKEQNIHVEITTLVISKVNDDITILSEIGKRILNDIGETTPWHLTKYFPAYKFSAPSTSIKFLEDTYQMAKEIGLKFVYLGNIHGHEYENTYCPECGKLLVKRDGMSISDIYIDKNLVCFNCKHDLKGYFIL